MAFIKEESEDVKIEETFRVKLEDTEIQTEVLFGAHGLTLRSHDQTNTKDLVALKEESPELNNVKEEKHLYEKHHNFITANNILVVQTKRSSSRKRAQTTRSRCYFTCQQCGKSFTKKGNLDGHMRIHTGEKPHICPQCGKSFTHQGTLNVHMRIHTGEKPFICHLCGKRFTVKGNLNTHMRVHTREKPFTCLQCEISFTHNKNLKHHLQTHSGKKLQCDEV